MYGDGIVRNVEVCNLEPLCSFALKNYSPSHTYLGGHCKLNHSFVQSNGRKRFSEPMAPIIPPPSHPFSVPTVKCRARVHFTMLHRLSRLANLFHCGHIRGSLLINVKDFFRRPTAQCSALSRNRIALLSLFKIELRIADNKRQAYGALAGKCAAANRVAYKYIVLGVV